MKWRTYTRAHSMSKGNNGRFFACSSLGIHFIDDFGHNILPICCAYWWSFSFWQYFHKIMEITVHDSVVCVRASISHFTHSGIHKSFCKNKAITLRTASSLILLLGVLNFSTTLTLLWCLLRNYYLLKSTSLCRAEKKANINWLMNCGRTGTEKQTLTHTYMYGKPIYTGYDIAQRRIDCV